jgi:hypothetical protein
MKRKKEPQYFYAVLDTPYLSKEDLWDYRPTKVVIIISDYDVSQIQKYIEFTGPKDNNMENRNSEGIGISVKYPVEAELVIYADPNQSMFDDDCAFVPSAEGIHICGDYMYYKMADYNDNWDIAEAEFVLSDLKPMKEWVLEKELNNLEKELSNLQKELNNLEN